MLYKHLGSRLIHSGEAAFTKRMSKAVSQPKNMPLYLSSVYSFDDVDALEAAYEDSNAGYIYARMANPNADALCEVLAAAEREDTAALVCASGMAAIVLTIISQMQSGDHIIATPVLYGGVYDYLKNELPRFGITVDFVDPIAQDLKAFFKPNTKLLYTETITNPLMEVFDLRALAQIAHEHDAKLAVDNTFATAAICKPLQLGADFSLYSATKYLCGHSDLTAGAILASPDLIEGLKRHNALYGAMLSAFDAWLLTRSLRTLHLRIKKHSQNAAALAEFFSGQTRLIEKVHYPGLITSPHHDTAKAQFSEGLYGGMLSIDFAGGMAAADRFTALCEGIKLVPSLAGVATSISYPKRTSHRAYSDAELAKTGIAKGQLRISAGLEEAEDLIAEFERVLKKL